MASAVKKAFLTKVSQTFGPLRKLGRSHSLFRIGDDVARIYIRYSKVHGGQKTFYGLRDTDLRELQGYPSFICFLWDDQEEPLIVPYSEYEDVFLSTQPAEDGQYKTQIYLRDDSTELYIARAGRFNVDAYFGWGELEQAAKTSGPDITPSLSHSQVQTLLGAIGAAKGHDIWIPPKDRDTIDWSLSHRFVCRDTLPQGYEPAEAILREIDVLWIQRGGNELKALYEVEHSSPIYSGLLRFNDIYLVSHSIRNFTIVSNEKRRSVFTRQLNRPTFQASGLSGVCAFLEYKNVYQWHKRIYCET